MLTTTVEGTNNNSLYIERERENIAGQADAGIFNLSSFIVDSLNRVFWVVVAVFFVLLFHRS